MSGLDNYVNNLKSAFVTLGTDFVYAMLVSKVPFLGWPVISYVVKALIKSGFTEASNAAEFAAFAKYIDVRVTKQGNEFVTAMQAHQLAQKLGSQKDKDDAEKALRQSFANLARITS